MEHDDYGVLERCVSEIAGKTLSSVVFVHDYRQFVFQGPCLSALSDPKFQHAGLVIEQGQPGYCDAFVSQIERTVTSVSVRDRELVVIFDSGAEFRFSLIDTAECGEALTYWGIDSTKTWLVV